MNDTVVNKTYINHVAFVVDESGSMQYHRDAVNRVVRDLSATMGQGDNDEQKTLLSLYTFNDTTKCHFLDAAPKAIDFDYRPNHQTALIDATISAINELSLATRRQRPDEDHSFLLYVLTDGEENRSRNRSSDLRRLLEGLGDEWTVAAMVPNLSGVSAAKNCGFAAGNIEIWNVSSSKGFEEAGRRMADTYTSYRSLRASGVAGTKTLFSLSASNLTPEEVRQNLTPISGQIITAATDAPIRPLVEAALGSYQIGSAYYQVTKREDVQPQKKIVIVSKKDGAHYGGDAARQLLGLPNRTVRVVPEDFGEWDIFVQSTSVNRKVLKGTRLFIRD